MTVIRSSYATKGDLLSAVNEVGQRLISVRVIDIILDENHPKFNEFGNYDSIGTIFYTKIENDTPLESEKFASFAKPLFSFIKSYPLINEIVLIVSANDKKIYNTPNSITNYYFPNINVWNSPHHNALPTVKGLKETTTLRNYENTQNGIIKSPSDPPQIPLGNYFNEQLNIKSLLPYEGDNIIEGRFGNSIRFGSTSDINNPWSSTGSIGDPITIIRNGQDKNLTTGWIPTVEDINNDNSSLYMTSTQQLSNFIPASTNQKSFGANFIAPVPIEIQFTEVPANTVVIEPTSTPISNEEFIIDESESYVPSIQPTPTSSNPISNDPFGDYESEVLEAGGDVGFYEVERETDENEITPQSDDIIDIDPDNNPIPTIIPSGSDEGITTEDVLTELGEYGVFNLNDLVYSKTADTQNINNLPGVDGLNSNDPEKSFEYINNNLKNLAVNVLTPLHEKYGDDMVITSCYRCSVLDIEVGGSGKGEHTRGAAADIQVKNVPTSEIFNYIKNNFETWRAMIWEHPERGTNPKSRASWVHIAYEETFKGANGNYKGLQLKTDNPDIAKYYRSKGATPSKKNDKYTNWSPNQGDWTDANQDLIT